MITSVAVFVSFRHFARPDHHSHTLTLGHFTAETKFLIERTSGCCVGAEGHVFLSRIRPTPGTRWPRGRRPRPGFPRRHVPPAGRAVPVLRAAVQAEGVSSDTPAARSVPMHETKPGYESIFTVPPPSRPPRCCSPAPGRSEEARRSLVVSSIREVRGGLRGRSPRAGLRRLAADPGSCG